LFFYWIWYYFAVLILPFLHKADVWLLVLINGLHHPVMDGLMPLISTTWFWAPVWVLVLWLWYDKLGGQAWFPILLSVLLVVWTDQTSAHLLKPFFERLRPCWNPELVGKLHILEGICGGKYGFVSSHAANTAGFMVFTCIIIRKAWLKWLCLVMVLLVGYSRVYLAVHYPMDIVLGWLLGVIFGQLMVFLYFTFLPRLI
jgi:undecaprenyl-diphosphatase